MDTGTPRTGDIPPDDKMFSPNFNGILTAEGKGKTEMRTRLYSALRVEVVRE